MKVETTAKSVKTSSDTIICVGYCTLQSLLSTKTPVAYTAGIYGWNADIYRVNNAVICTGYRPFGNIHPKYETIEKYEQAAQRVRQEPWDNYESLKAEMAKLLNEFVQEVVR